MMQIGIYEDKGKFAWKIGAPSFIEGRYVHSGYEQYGHCIEPEPPATENPETSPGTQPEVEEDSNDIIQDEFRIQ